MGFQYATERQERYVDTAGVVHGQRHLNAGRFSVGPKISYTIEPDQHNIIRPWVSAQVEYDFSNANSLTGSGLPDLDDFTSLRLGLGVNMNIGDKILSFKGRVFGLGSGEFLGYGGEARILIPF